MGMSVTEILAFYVDNGAKMFDRASIIRRLQYQYKSEPLALQLQKVFGEETTLGAPELNGACPLSHAHANRKSRLGKCAPLTFAASWSIAKTIAAATRSRSARTNGPMTSGSPISRRGLSVRPAASGAPTCGRTFIGTSRRSRRWAIASAPIPRRRESRFDRGERMPHDWRASG
jgi:hypothetical protein